MYICVCACPCLGSGKGLEWTDRTLYVNICPLQPGLCEGNPGYLRVSGLHC